ncbi:hypothetical protein L6452_37621 [Arctium lappa]|uniref:Uncharacterized protein n=1 Tax=Arctium lappa TaxID=4217 RepID=A0ACB8Y4L7_ARCLA|nr:hypothetical protein L6452_37621 [Arctium lappa]
MSFFMDKFVKHFADLVRSAKPLNGTDLVLKTKMWMEMCVYVEELHKLQQACNPSPSQQFPLHLEAFGLVLKSMWEISYVDLQSICHIQNSVDGTINRAKLICGLRNELICGLWNVIDRAK